LIIVLTDSPRQSPRVANKNKPKDEKEAKVLKHDIVVVKDGTQYIKDPEIVLENLSEQLSILYY
jgi:hypothetical protein